MKVLVGISLALNVALVAFGVALSSSSAVSDGVADKLGWAKASDIEGVSPNTVAGARRATAFCAHLNNMLDRDIEWQETLSEPYGDAGATNEDKDYARQQERMFLLDLIAGCKV